MLCVIAKIDSVARKRLVRLLSILERFGIPPRNVYGHITLAAYTGKDENGFLSSCKASLSEYKKFSIRYETIEVFASTSMIAAVPRAEKNLAAIHKEISGRWAADLNKWTQEGVWQAHTTLVYDPQADLHAVAGALREGFEPFAARIDRLEFSRVCEGGYEIVDFIELG